MNKARWGGRRGKIRYETTGDALCPPLPTIGRTGAGGERRTCEGRDKKASQGKTIRRPRVGKSIRLLGLWHRRATRCRGLRCGRDDGCMTWVLLLTKHVARVDFFFRFFFLQICFFFIPGLLLAICELLMLLPAWESKGSWEDDSKKALSWDPIKLFLQSSFFLSH